MTSPNPDIPILDDDAVGEIAEMFPHTEYQPEAETMPLCAFCEGAIDDHKANCVVPHVHALCQTVRALRETLKAIRDCQNDKCNHCAALLYATREQLK